MSRDDFRVDFFGIGAPRCRTTWLAQCLDEHPAIAISRTKEPEYFVEEAGIFETHINKRYKADWPWYRSQWDHARPGQLRGDFSINLLHNAQSAPMDIQEVFPDARFFAVLRDPVARTYSHYWYFWGQYRQWGGVPQTFEEAMLDETLLRRSRYAASLGRWLEVFPRDRFHVILDMDMRADEAKVVRDAYRFLGVEERFQPPSLSARINASHGRRGLYGSLYRVSQRLRRVGLGPMIDLAKKAGAVRVVNRMDYKDFEYPPIKPETAAALREVLMPDIEALERLLGRDLGAWKTGASVDDGDAGRRRAKHGFRLRPPPA